MALGGRAPGLPRGRLHGKQLLVGCMKAALLAAIRERQVGGGGNYPPPIKQTINKEKGEIRRGRKQKKRKAKREGGGRGGA